MATIKTVEFHCPHCNKKVSSIPRNDYCGIKGRLYGAPYETCRKCKKTYRHPFAEEAASALTLTEKVPFWITSTRFMVFIIIVAVFLGVVTYGIGALAVAPVYLAACALTRNYRQEHKNKLLRQSRERLKEPEYFVRHLVANTYIPDKSRLTPAVLAVLHVRAMRIMDEDRPLVVGDLVKEVLTGR